MSDDVGGRLISVEFPLSGSTGSNPSEHETLFQALTNPYFVRDHPGLTQTLGWVDAWTLQPSVYAVEASNVADIVAAVDFAREHHLRLAIKGTGHSYQGTSSAPDSLLLWTRDLTDISMQTRFVPRGCEGQLESRPAVTLGAGTIWMEAYEAVTTRAGRYVQGGGCTTVGVAGLILSGGFGSFSKHSGLAAASLLEAEVVTADGETRIANPCNNPDLFWALKGGGASSLGVLSRLTLELHELPEFFGDAVFTIRARSDYAFRQLLLEFVKFYYENLFNDYWGEQVGVNPGNTLSVTMVSLGLDTEESKRVWQPFLNLIAGSNGSYVFEGSPIIESIPARKWWGVEWKKGQPSQEFVSDSRSNADPNNVWWQGDVGQVGWFIHGYESLWLPKSLLERRSQERFADALFASSRHWRVELHFNKGLAGAPTVAVKSAQDTAMNPKVLTSFALAIAAGGQKPAYPGIPGHEPDTIKGRKRADAIRRCIGELRSLAPDGGSYVSESNYFEKKWQQSYWGENYPRLASVKEKYDPMGVFCAHNGVGSEA